MTIHKINGIIPNNYRQNSNFEKTASTKISDSVSISENAKAMQKKIIPEIKLKNSPIIREDKVNQAKLNLEKYFNDGQLSQKISDKIADKIADSLFF